jgi:septum formation protein
MIIYLASQSPRRRELLNLMDVSFDLLPMDIPEIRKDNETPEQYSTRITTEKLQAGWDYIVNHHLEPRPVLCADTECVLDGKIYGKPNDFDHAFAMLKSYSGKTHKVITSVGLKYKDYQNVVLHTTLVTFNTLTDENIRHYLAKNDYKDKSGGYAIQSYIGQFVSRIEGCFYSIRGLPLNVVRELLNDVERLTLR